MRVTLTGNDLKSIRNASHALLEAAATLNDLRDFRLSAARALRSLLGADRAAFFWNEEGVTPWVSEDFSQHILEDFAANAAHTEGDATKYIAKIGSTEWTTGQLEELTGLRVLESDFGDRWFKPERLREGAGIMLNAGYRGYCELGVAGYRGSSRRGLWGNEARALLTLVEPAFMAAVHVVKVLHSARVALSQTLDLIPDGVGFCDARGALTECNAKLREWITTDGELKVAVCQAARRALEWQSASASVVGRRVSFRMDTKRGPYLISGTLAPEDSSPGNRALVAVTRLGLPRVPSHTLQETFHLTRREIDVYRLLVLGKRNAEIAGALGISAHTARHHTEVILRKTGAGTRAQLVALSAGWSH